MAEPRQITLDEQGAPNIVLQPLQARYPNLDLNFKLKSSLINLLPKYHRLPGQDPIRHLKDFQVACSTTRRHGADEVAIMVFAFPFSLEAQAKTWFYTLPDEIATNWNFLRREFLNKFFPPEKTDYIRKEISGIMQRDQESLYEYWSRFKRLLESCPHHGMNTHLLISYFTGGLCVEDRRLLTASSSGSLSKNKMEGEAWSLIEDVAEATQHTRVRSNHLKSVVEPSPSEASLTKALGDMTIILTQIHKDQKKFYSIQAVQAPPPVALLEGPPRIYSLCSSTTHYTDQCHQIQEEHALVLANVNYNNRPPYPSQSQNHYPHGSNQHQGWRDNAQGNNQIQRWNNSPSHHNNNYQANQNQNNYTKYQVPHHRQQSNHTSPPSTNQIEELKATVKKWDEGYKAQFEAMNAQLANLADIISKMSISPSNNTNQPSSSSNLPS
ncbi:uncharacterized protein LOC130939955 [Arachis stenosperma]|uniref:uncharacterized protein LOC130939955 n=1 Tax=Arachis stenosperma TaxID=217475 RepID=UPI0025ACCA21|nr:uncharacterized protein LOC130939955 [Arachis stenosperma]